MTSTFAPAFERLLSECHPLSLARSPMNASGQLSPAARHLWRQFSEGGWLDLGSAALRTETMAEMPLIGALSGRFLLTLPLAFSALVLAPLIDIDAALAAQVLAAPIDAQPVSGRVDLWQEPDVLPVDFFGSDSQHCQVLFAGQTVIVRCLHAHPFVQQGLDAGVPVSMVLRSPSSVAAQHTLAIDPRETVQILHPFFVFQYSHLIGAAAASLDLAIAYAKERTQFRRPIGEFQAIKHLLANAWIALDNGRYAVNALSKTAAEDVSFHERVKQTHRIVTAGAKLATRTSIQVHGAIGFAWEHDAHLFLKRVYRGTAQLTALADSLR